MGRCKMGYAINEDGTIPQRCHVDWDVDFYPTVCKECPFYSAVIDMNEMDYGLTYGCVAEFLNDTSLWFEPITDEIDGLVLRDGNASIIQMWMPINFSSPLDGEEGYPVT